MDVNWYMLAMVLCFMVASFFFGRASVLEWGWTKAKIDR
jgi:hypothetical protein